MTKRREQRYNEEEFTSKTPRLHVQSNNFAKQMDRKEKKKWNKIYSANERKR